MKLKIGDVVSCKNTEAKWFVADVVTLDEGKEHYHMFMISENAIQGVYEDKVDDFYTKIDFGNQVMKPLSEKAFLDIRGVFLRYMNDPTVTEQEKMGVDLCLMALDAYYDCQDKVLFNDMKGLTKEEADRYEKSLMKLFKPTGRNRFEEDSE